MKWNQPAGDIVGLGYKHNLTETAKNGVDTHIRNHDAKPASTTHLSENNKTDASPFTNGEVKKSGHALEIQHVSYTVKQRVGSWWKGCCFRPVNEKTILRDVTVRMTGGQLTGILGNSGSGKTSLLDVISRRNEGSYQGQVTFDGENLTMARFRRIGGYVIQADRLLANLTVRETLTYTAMLKFIGHERSSDIKKRVSNVIQEMGLNHVASSFVGGYLVRGISGGERRRVSIAAQLLQDPYLLLLDEPTTGLDSFTAHALIHTLSHLAQTMDSIILMTIHQPRSDIFNLFDNIAILCAGQVQFFGPRSELVPHFTRLGYPCPTYANPLDHYVDISSIDYRNAEIERHTSQRVNDLHTAYLQSQLHIDVINASQQWRSGQHGNSVRMSDEHCRRFFYLTSVLLRRMFLNLWRDRSGFVHRFMTYCTFALFLWLLLWRLNRNIETAIQDRTGVLFQSISAGAIMGLLNALALFPVHRALYDREAREGLYTSEHMVAAYCIHILPFTLLASILFAVWAYWGLGMQPEQSRFWVFFGVCCVQHYLGDLITVLILSVVQNKEVAGSISLVTFTMFLILGAGLIRSQANLLTPLQWLAYAIFYKYSAEIAVATEYHLLKFDCQPGQELLYEFFDGDTYLNEAFPGAVQNMARNAGILVAFVAGTWILLLLFFRVRGIKHLN